MPDNPTAHVAQPADYTEPPYRRVGEGPDGEQAIKALMRTLVVPLIRKGSWSQTFPNLEQSVNEVWEEFKLQPPNAQTGEAMGNTLLRKLGLL